MNEIYEQSVLAYEMGRSIVRYGRTVHPCMHRLWRSPSSHDDTIFLVGTTHHETSIAHDALSTTLLSLLFLL